MFLFTPYKTRWQQYFFQFSHCVFLFTPWLNAISSRCLAALPATDVCVQHSHAAKRLLPSIVASPRIWGVGQKFLGDKILDFRPITLFFLEKRLSKRKITIFSKNWGRAWPLWRPPDYACVTAVT